MKKYLLLLFTAFFINHSDAQIVGDLDSTFSADGIATSGITGFEDYAFSILVQSDQKILAGGYSTDNNTDKLFITRFNANGTPDNGFGVASKISIAGLNMSGGTALAQLSNGKIIATATSNNNFAVLRFNTNGKIDSTFGTNGTTIIDFGGNDDPSALTILASGKILVAGTKRIGGTDWDYAITRLNADGSIDNAFGTNGIVTTNISSVGDYGQNILVLPNNKFIVSGYSGFPPGLDFSMVRYSANGIVDSTFATNGRVLTDFSGDDDYCYGAALRSDGKIILCGYSRLGGNGSDIALARYNANGTPDNTFDGDGKLNIHLANSQYSDGTSILLQPDEKMLLTATLSTGNAVMRCNEDGTLDNTFAIGGISTNVIGSGYNRTRAIALQADLKIVTAGYYYNGSTNDIFVCRYGSGLTVGLADHNNSRNHFSIYPNPASDYTIIKQNIFTNAKLIVTDVAGRKVFEGEVTNGDYTLQTGGLKSGVYFVVMENDERKIIEKIVIE